MSPAKSGEALTFKVVLLGESCVGKTSVAIRFVDDSYTETQATTLQASYLTRRLRLGNGREAALAIWDTAGQERFHALGPIYYRDADGALLVYDLSEGASFGRVRAWTKELRRVVGDDISLAVVGNKKDLSEEQRRVDLQMAEE